MPDDPPPPCKSDPAPGPPFIMRPEAFARLETADPLLHFEIARHGRIAGGMWFCDPATYASILDRLGRTPAP